MSHSGFYAGLAPLLVLFILSALTSIAACARSPLVYAAIPAYSRQQKGWPKTGVTKVLLRAALLDARSAKKAYLASKQRAKELIAMAKKPGASRADKRAAINSVAAVRRDAKLLKAALAKLRSLRNRSVAPKAPTQKPVSETTAVVSKKPVRKTGPVVSKKPTQKRSIPMMKNAVNTMSKKVMKINGRKLPMNCYCAKQRAGESKCYYFTKARFCSVRNCAASYVCVGRQQSRGTLCLLRRVRTRIVPFKNNVCRVQRIDSFMYVPYARY